MSEARCIHPNCETLTAPGRIACGRHWFQIPEDLRRQLSRCGRDKSQRGALKVQIREYLADRMIGEHEISICRGPDCHADIVWLTGERRDGSEFRIVVDASTVEPTDVGFVRNKHVVHFDTCPNGDALRRKK